MTRPQLQQLLDLLHTIEAVTPDLPALDRHAEVITDLRATVDALDVAGLILALHRALETP